jgi:hypothetical protein
MYRFRFARTGTAPVVTPPTGVVAFRGCMCELTPGYLMPPKLTMTFDGGTSFYGFTFNSATFTFQALPAYLGGLLVPDSVYLSDQFFPDPASGGNYQYLIGCEGGDYYMCRVYAHTTFVSPLREDTRFRWYGSLAGNTCTPFFFRDGREPSVGGHTVYLKLVPS